MTHTGVFLTAAQYAEITELIELTMQINLKTNITVYETRKAAATARLQEMAHAAGLPALTGSKGYGLTAARELVAPD
jgi:hypothetical protein